MPLPSSTTTQLPRNDSFSAADIHKAFKASASKPRNDLSLRIVDWFMGGLRKTGLAGDEWSVQAECGNALGVGA
ncbi:hypothetical protein B0A55_06534 [Friedmanniomyces simplex]|uniref:Uncharacterized protein n=1 Tax=Friedmanniomyces simplex TaxID=329884 RepID=A0A4U0X1M5_9PEZI|nr:hypothetical protein B0A55_06534 [Friedmanniomyces simplex]